MIMYNEQLEQLIDAALADGELSGKEKQILFKKAQSFGIDLDEFEMVLDARLLMLKKNEAEKKAQATPKSNKLGDVKKCPSCGANVQSFQGVCPDCGYAFENVAANEAVKKLSELLNKAEQDEMSDRDDYVTTETVIKTFPVPSSKANLIELISFIQTSISNEENPYTRKAFEAKLQECFMKAKLMFPNDAHLQNIIQEVDKINRQLKSERNKSNAKSTVLGVFLIVVGLFVGYRIWCLDWKVIWRVLTISYTAFFLLMWGIIKLDDKKE